MKLCKGCGIEKPLSGFQKNKNRKDGLQVQCRECHQQYWKERHAQAKMAIPPEEHTCSRCQETKPSSEFNKGTSGDTGLSHSCKGCNRRYDVLYRYGISFEDYERMVEEQYNCCKICSVDFDELNRAGCVDHDHDTGEVRGILCGNCNKALGCFKDNIEVMQKAIEYLAQSQLTEV